MSNPYKDLPDHCYWSRAMTNPAPGHVDPATGYYTIAQGDKIATLGSCFAQHLSRHIKRSGLNYYVAELPPPDMSADEAKRRNYSVFSARYGNVYTVKQAVQLFDRAFNGLAPVDDVWARGDRFVDAFRPQIEPDGYSSPDEVRASAAEHLGYVRDVFTQSDCLVFTLGLTEAWRSKLDGAIYPMAPGVAGGDFDKAKYEFVNFSAHEVQNDLADFIVRLRTINSKLRIILTVSPVALIATYENRHVWVSTTYSKAALRVAADHAERLFKDVIYFPSYEIITSPSAGGRYYADDLRQVTELGVSHVMRVFSKHFIDGPPQDSEAQTFGANESTGIGARPALNPQFDDDDDDDDDVVCDEKMIEKALRRSGF